MPSGFRRWFITLAVTLALFGAAGALPGRGSESASLTAQAQTVQSPEMGLSPSVAARALNALAARDAKQHARSLTEVNFILNWLPNVEFAGLWVAQSKGWWQKAGIKMTYKGWSPSVHPETDVPARGGNTFGFQSGAAIAIARAQKVPIKALYTDVEKSVFALTVLKSSGITRLTQLRGKRVGYQPHELYVPETMLSCVGLKDTDWRPVAVSFDIVQLTAKNVDAYLTFVTNEPIALEMKGIPIRNFLASDYCFHFYDDVLFTADQLISSNPSLVRKVVGIVARGFKWAHQHPVAAAQLTTRTYFPSSVAGKDIFGKPTTTNSNLTQQIRELRSFDHFSRDARGRFSGLMSAKTWKQSVNILYKYHQINTKPSASSLFTNAFNPNH